MLPLLQMFGKGTCFACFNAWYATGLTQVWRSFTVKVTPAVRGDHRYACLITILQSKVMQWNGHGWYTHVHICILNIYNVCHICIVYIYQYVMGHTSTALNKLHFSDIGLSFHGEIHEKLGQIATRNQLPVTCAFIGIVFRIEATACISETAPGAIARNISTGLPAIFACQLRLRLYKCVGFPFAYNLHCLCWRRRAIGYSSTSQNAFECLYHCSMPAFRSFAGGQRVKFWNCFRVDSSEGIAWKLGNSELILPI